MKISKLLMLGGFMLAFHASYIVSKCIFKRELENIIII